MTVRPLRAFAEVSLGRQRSPANDSGPNMVPYLRAANVLDGCLALADVKQMNFTPAEQSIFRLRDGDILVTEGSGSVRTVGASAVWHSELEGTVCFQNTLLRVRPREGTDGRYLAWWCRHAFADGLFASVATGANIFHLSAERVRALPMIELPLEEQRAIADHLDQETARIDALIAAKQRTVALYRERRQALRDLTFRFAPGLRLKHLLAGPMAYGVLVPEFVEDGDRVPMIRTYNLTTRGGVDHQDLAEIPRALADQYKRTYLRDGDVVLSVVGSMGRSAVATPAEAGCNLNRPLARLRPRSELPSRLLWHWTQTTLFADAAALATGGGTAQPTLNLGDLANFIVGLPSDSRRWKPMLAELEASCARLDELEDAARRQISLLEERRQALITAMITRDLSVSVAA